MRLRPRPHQVGDVVINRYPRGYWCDEHRTTEAVTQWWNAATAAAS